MFEYFKIIKKRSLANIKNKFERIMPSFKLTIKQHLEILKQILSLLNDNTRLRIIMLLFIHDRISLPDLQKNLQLTKSTISRQIQKFDSLRLINVEEVKVRGSIKSKIYSINRDLCRFPTTYINKMMKIPVNDVKIVELYQYEVYSLVFAFYSKIYSAISKYYAETVEIIKKIDIISPLDHIPCRTFFTTLDKENYNELLSKIEEMATEYEKKSHDEQGFTHKPYFLQVTGVPVEEVVRRKINK
jgi:DNA-binding transcriptional ArsR family regulator